MKKYSILICYFIIVLTVILFFVSSEAKANPLGNIKRDFASILNIKAAGLTVQKDSSADDKDSGGKPLRALSMNLNKGLDAFLDFSSPAYQGLGPKNDTADLRTVFGFHIPLQ